MILESVENNVIKLFEVKSSIRYSDISDLEQYKNYALDILGGYGNQSDNGILDNTKEIYIDDKLVGYISFEEYDDIDGYNKCLGFGNFMILDRGKGYGTQVLKDLVEKHKDRFDLIYCYVDAENSRAIDLYKKLGVVHDEDGLTDDGQYYVTFWDNSDLTEAKKKKSRKKKHNALGWFQTFNPDAGNVEYNNAFFNHVMGNTSTAEFGEAAANAGSCGMGESFNNPVGGKDLNTDKKELFAKMCRENHFLQMITTGEFGKVMNNFLETNDVAALVNDIKHDGSVSLSNDEIECIVRNYFTDTDEVVDVQYGVHDFNQQSIIFRGTEEECAEFIDNNGLWDDAEIYTIKPDDPHYINEDVETKICSICGEEFEGWGNNAWPVNDGTCCDSCNYLFVLPERIRNLQKKKETPDVREAFEELNKLDD